MAISEATTIYSQRLYLPSFSRKKSRGLTKNQQLAMKRVFNKIALSLDDLPQAPFHPNIFFPETITSYAIEIGFGSGEFLQSYIRQFPDYGLMGCEIFINGIANLVTKLGEENNLRLFQGDGRDLVRQLAPETIDRVFILFPDPWPKRAHFKRRLINEQLIHMLYPCQKQGGELIIATDHIEYGQWIASLIDTKSAFYTLVSDSSNPPSYWVPTRYEMKTRAEGRVPRFFILERNERKA